MWYVARQKLISSRWPTYSPVCRRDVQRLLQDGTSLTALRANPTVGVGPREGSWCLRLEALASRMTGREAIACANATLGLTAALKALELPSGSEVATTALTFSATAAAILHAGARPWFFDVDPQQMTLSLEYTSEIPRCLLPVDLFGRVHSEMMPWGGMPIIQDACQAVCSEGAGAKAQGDLVVWSFNGRKNVPAGEGGMVLAKDPDLARRARLWLSHAENFGTPWVGTNGHLNEVSACLAYHGLKVVKARNRVRQQRATLLNKLLQDLPIRVFPDPEDHAFYVYPLILHASVDRDRLVKALTRLGVQTQPGYIIPPLHEYQAFRNCRRSPLPVTEELSRKTLLLLPTQITSETTEADVRWLAVRMRAAFTLTVV